MKCAVCNQPFSLRDSFELNKMPLAPEEDNPEHAHFVCISTFEGRDISNLVQDQVRRQDLHLIISMITGLITAPWLFWNIQDTPDHPLSIFSKACLWLSTMKAALFILEAIPKRVFHR